MSFLKDLAKLTIGAVLRLFSRRKTIVFESTPDFADNTFPVYEQLLRRGLDEKYTFVWSCSKEQHID